MNLSNPPAPWGRWLGLSAVALLALVLWDLSPLDLWLADLAGGPGRFAVRDHWLLAGVMHQGMRALSWAVYLALLVMVVWPIGPLRRLSRGERVQLVLTITLALLVVVVLKRVSLTSCPWDLTRYGGMAQHVSHWRLGVPDGGPGHCFPAGHASAALAYLAGWFVWQRREPVIAARWLAVCLLMGLALGVAQQLRGAHFMSHTLWTAWLCWCSGLLVEALARLHQRLRLTAPGRS